MSFPDRHWLRQAMCGLPRKTDPIKALTVLCAAAFSVHAHAQDEALSYPIGETDLYPSVRIEYSQTSNAFLTAEDEVEATGVTVEPELRWVADRRLLSLEGLYRGNYHTSSESALNFNDHVLRGDVRAELSKRQRVQGTLSFQRLHQELGTEITRGIAEEAGEQLAYNELAAEARFIYGVSDAKGNLEAALRIENFAFASQTDFLDALTDGADYTLIEPSALFSYRLSPDTRAVAEVRFGQYNYSESLRDRSDITLLGGLRFAATGKLTGDFRVGTTLANFSDDAVDDTSELVLEATLDYEAASFNTFSLEVSRDFDNDSAAPTLNGAAQSITDKVRLLWRYDWSSRVFHQAVLGRTGFDRTCPDNDVATTFANLELNFKLRRWLSFGVTGRTTNRSDTECPDADPDEPALDFQRQTIGVQLRATL